MEWLPKLVDTFDSGVFSVRLAWAGYHGQMARSVLKILALVIAIIVSPAVLLGIAAVAVMTYFLTEMAYRLCMLVSRLGPTPTSIGR